MSLQDAVDVLNDLAHARSVDIGIGSSAAPLPPTA
jgi:hypothetical protein